MSFCGHVEVTSAGICRGCGACLTIVICCNAHNRNCEPPGDLCCERCSEAAHGDFPTPHADGSRCVLAVAP